MTSTSRSSETAAEQQSEQAVDGNGRNHPQSDRQLPQGHAEIATLPQRQPPSLVEACLLHGHAPMPPQVSVIMHQDALAQVKAHATSNLRTELGGALLGKAYQHNGTVFVEIEAALPATSGDHGPVHFTFNADSWRQLQQDKADQYPHLDMVGWFHTHPGLGVFYSGDDVVVHSAAFTLPWHVGLVVDPIRSEACFFGWSGPDLVPFRGFYERLDEQENSVVAWQVVRTSVWDEPYDPARHGALAETQSGSRVVTSGSQTAVGAAGGLLGLVVGGLGLLLSFFLFVGGIVPLNSQVNDLEQVVLTLAEQNAINTAVCPAPTMRILSPGHEAAIFQGSDVDFVGTADFPAPTRYRLEVRLVGSNTWQLVDAFRRSQTLGTLATWDTSAFAAAAYDVRLIAVDANNVRLADAPVCQTAVTLTRSTQP